MSFCICRVEKYNRGNIKAIGNHHSRTKDTFTSNADIDPSRTPHNINFGRISNLKTAVWDEINTRAPMKDGKARRKDAVLCFEVLVSASPNFWPENWQSLSQDEFRATKGYQYLNDAYRFLSEKFGKENFVGGSVHLDEKTPHMSVMFVPITNGKLCAKEILTRRVLRDLQTEIAEKVGKKYGLERGQEKSGTKHLPPDEYKGAKELERLKARFSSQIDSLNNMIQSVVAEDERWKMVHSLPHADKQRVFDYVATLIDQAPEVAPR